MGISYERAGYEIRGCDLALHFYREARRNGRRRGLGTMSQRSTVASTPASSDPNACNWCQAPLDALEAAAANDPVIIQRGRICRKCAAKQERVR